MNVLFLFLVLKCKKKCGDSIDFQVAKNRLSEVSRDVNARRRPVSSNETDKILSVMKGLTLISR